MLGFFNKKDSRIEIKIRDNHKAYYILQMELMSLETIKLVDIIEGENRFRVYSVDVKEEKKLKEILDKFDNRELGVLDNFEEKKVKRATLLRDFNLSLEGLN